MRTTFCFYQMVLFILSWLIGSAAALAPHQETLHVKYIGNNQQVSEHYYLDLIDAALAITHESHGDYQIHFAQEDLSSERKHDLLIAGEKLNIDRLVGFPTDEGPRTKLLCVDHPILKGAMGYRVLLIHKNNQATFERIHSLAALNELTMGFGRGWEGHVYSHNQFTLVEAHTMTNLLKMLAGQRYSFVPLSIIEVEDNYALEGQPAANLVIEKNLLLYMPLPVYFCVSPAAPQLAQRLQIGLDELDKSGAMDALFHKHFGTRLARLELAKRRLIELENPDADGSLPKANHKWLNRY
uniref:hypothetical protein n=1 Tax=Cellvibrio fontiphilus TaxID=1815559 RepID=UPI002B4BD3A5|nr:hypothetical protein [Cellvibrio fontiphilus]